jgi:hypothetical protein
MCDIALSSELVTSYKREIVATESREEIELEVTVSERERERERQFS